MENQKKIYSTDPAENLHDMGKDNAMKVGSAFVNPGMGEAIVQKSDLEDPQTSSNATASLRAFVGGGQEASQSKG
jgi:hypothetical protein